MKSFFVALIGAIIGLIAGFVAGAFAGAGIAAATHMSSFEGASGYFAVFFCGPIGGLIGLVLGVWIALRLRGVRAGIGGVAVYSGATIATLFAISGAVIWLMLTFDSTLNRNSAPKQALFEIRLPPGIQLDPNRRGIEVELNTERSSPVAFLRDDWRTDGDRPVITGGVDLAFRASSRIIVLKMIGQPDRLFFLKLAGNPSHSDSFGPWQPIDWIAEKDAASPRKATSADQYEIRYRVRDPNTEFSRPIIAFELVLPSSMALPDDLKAIKVRAIEGDNDMDGAIDPDKTIREGDRITLGGTVQLAGETHSLIEVAVPGAPARMFEVRLPAFTWITETIRYATTSPGDDKPAFSPWQSAAFVRQAGRKEPSPAEFDDDVKFRYTLR